MNIKVLGAGCSSCSQLYARVAELVSELNLDAELEFVEDLNKILAYEVLQLPALVINEKVVSSGKELSLTEIKNLLNKKESK